MAEGGWTHGKILGEWQQFALRRYLKLKTILPSLEKGKIISKKWVKYLAEEDYDVDLFLAQLKKKNVEHFTKFFEVLEETFNQNEDHRALVSIMSEHLLQISDADPEQRERIERVVASATGEKGLGTRVGFEKSEEGLTDISSVTQTAVLVDKGPFEEGETQSGRVTASPLQLSVPQQKPESLKIPVTEGESESSRGEGVGEEEPGTVYIRESTSDQAQSQTLEPYIPRPESASIELGQPLQSSSQAAPSLPLSSQPPGGYVAPRILKYFPRNELINNEWCFHNAAHGVSFQIPGDAVPPEIDCFALQICAYLQGPFQFPEEYELCTAIFHVQFHSRTPFQFLKPVTLRIPHSAFLEDDDEPDDFVILRAPDPDVVISPDGHTPIRSVYKFTDIIQEADFSSGYHAEVKLQHFSAIAGGKRKHKYRRPRSSSFHRQSPQTKRKRKRRFRKMVRQSSSIGSSRQSSVESSFEDTHSRLKHQQSPLVKQGSSVESDAPMPPRLIRQAAMDDDHKGHPSPLPWCSSSLDDASESCNELYMCSCSPANRTDHWMTRFMVACYHPTGMMALRNTINVNMDWEEKRVTPYNNTISFCPVEHKESNWRVYTDTPKISLEQITSLSQVEGAGHIQMYPPCITYSMQRLQSFSNSPLSLKIHVEGIQEYDGETYFMISSTAEHNHTGRVLHSPSWLYPQGSKIQQSLQSETNIILSPLDPDHCKLIADISFQLAEKEYSSLVTKLAISEANLDQLERGETSNLPECIYKVLISWLGMESVTLFALKSVLGVTSIETNKPLLPFNPDLYDMPFDVKCMLKLSKTIGDQWRFFGRYLGVPREKLDELSHLYQTHSLREVVYRMFHEWRLQYGNDANLGTLLKIVYRVWRLSPDDGTHAWFEAQELAEI